MIMIDIPVPKCCWDCPCCHDGLDCAVYLPKNFKDEGFDNASESKPDWCPIDKELLKQENLLKKFEAALDNCDSVYGPCEEFRCAACDLYYFLRDNE